MPSIQIHAALIKLLADKQPIQRGRKFRAAGVLLLLARQCGLLSQQMVLVMRYQAINKYGHNGEQNCHQEVLFHVVVVKGEYCGYSKGCC